MGAAIVCRPFTAILFFSIDPGAACSASRRTCPWLPSLRAFGAGNCSALVRLRRGELFGRWGASSAGNGSARGIFQR
jgi:hypothetical protein